MDCEQILRLINAVSDSDITEFEYQEEAARLVLKKGQAPVYVMAAENGKGDVPLLQAPSVQPEAPGGEGSPASSVHPASEEIIRSPLVGTFYAAPSEDGEPYVKAGDEVKKGQILGIIESMKLMNEIECPRDGVISAVLIENEQIVEYGQPLFQFR